MQLPLERLAALREDLHLPRDQRVELVPVEAGEVAVLDEPVATEARGPHEWPVPLDANGVGQTVVHVRAQLRLVGVEQLSRHSNDPTRRGLGRCGTSSSPRTRHRRPALADPDAWADEVESKTGGDTSRGDVVGITAVKEDTTFERRQR